MARERSPNRDRSYQVWLDHKGNITIRQIAEIIGEDEKKISVWKQRDHWSVQQSNVVQQSSDNVVQQKNECCTTKKPGAPKGNKNDKGHGPPKGSKNALGNKGGCPAQGNKNAEKHGFFSRIFPDDEETREIIASIDIMSPIEMLWQNIVIQYTAIARAQRIMYVKNQDDLTKELKRHKDMDNGTEEEWELQFAWDKHAGFLQAQSRAMVTLQGMIGKYDEMMQKDMATEEQQLRINKLKADVNIEEEKLKISKAKLLLDIEKAKGENKSNQHVDALRQKMNERKKRNGSS